MCDKKCFYANRCFTVCLQFVIKKVVKEEEEEEVVVKKMSSLPVSTKNSSMQVGTTLTHVQISAQSKSVLHLGSM